MPCLHVKLPGGAHAIVKVANPRRKRCYVCGVLCSTLCDFPVPEHKSGTCDRACCQETQRECWTGQRSLRGAFK